MSGFYFSLTWRWKILLQLLLYLYGSTAAAYICHYFVFLGVQVCRVMSCSKTNLQISKSVLCQVLFLSFPSEYIPYILAHYLWNVSLQGKKGGTFKPGWGSQRGGGGSCIVVSTDRPGQQLCESNKQWVISTSVLFCAANYQSEHMIITANTKNLNACGCCGGINQKLKMNCSFH